MKRVAAAVLLLALFLTGCAPETTWQEQYDLGVRYLSEGNYEQAILAFTAAIEIDPKQPETYLSLADVYVARGDMESARAVLEEGLEATDSSDISARLEKMSAQTAVPEPAQELEQAEVTSSDNLTGKTKFSVKDCEEWGYPYRCTLFDLQKNGMATDSNSEELIEQSRISYPDWGDGGYYGSTVQDENPEISVYTSTRDLYVWSIKENGEGNFVGPRGIGIGQTLKDIINRFYCENMAVIEYAETLSMDIAQENFEKQENGRLLASLWDRNMDYGSINQFAYLDIFEDGRSELNYCDYVDGKVCLVIEFQDGIVVSYTVVYHEPWVD